MGCGERMRYGDPVGRGGPMGCGDPMGCEFPAEVAGLCRHTGLRRPHVVLRASATACPSCARHCGGTATSCIVATPWVAAIQRAAIAHRLKGYVDPMGCSGVAQHHRRHRGSTGGSIGRESSRLTTFTGSLSPPPEVGIRGRPAVVVEQHHLGAQHPDARARRRPRASPSSRRRAAQDAAITSLGRLLSSMRGPKFVQGRCGEGVRLVMAASCARPHIEREQQQPKVAEQLLATCPRNCSSAIPASPAVAPR